MDIAKPILNITESEMRELLKTIFIKRKYTSEFEEFEEEIDIGRPVTTYRKNIGGHTVKFRPRCYVYPKDQGRNIWISVPDRPLFSIVYSDIFCDYEYEFCFVGEYENIICSVSAVNFGVLRLKMVTTIAMSVNGNTTSVHYELYRKMDNGNEFSIFYYDISEAIESFNRISIDMV